MAKILDLPHGWSLHHEYTCEEIGPLPLLVHRRWGRFPNAKDVARRPEGREVFRAIKLWLDEADQRMAYGAQAEGSWKAADKAKMAMTP
jgi:hypothetical protein